MSEKEKSQTSYSFLFSSDSESDYVSSLASLGILGVSQESSRVSKEKELLERQTQNLALNNYKTFIETARVYRELSREFDEATVHLNHLSSVELFKFSSDAQIFAEKAKNLSTKRKMTSLVLSKHSQILQVLELPQLTETCVRNCHYEEALQLINYAKKLDKKIGSIAIVSNVLTSIANSRQLMVNQLLGELRYESQLHSCLRVVGLLKSLNVYNDSELRLKFLESREFSLNALLISIPTESPLTHLSKVMEVTRSHLVDIITQYRAIFCSEPSYSSSSSSSRLIFFSWILRRISSFISVFEEDISKRKFTDDEDEDGSLLHSLLGQAMYFGQSLSRSGLDFRSLLIPKYLKVLQKSSLRHLIGAEHRFRVSMDKIALKANLRNSDFTENDGSPSNRILEFYPLAELYNSVIRSYNHLLGSAPLVMAPILYERLKALTKTCVSFLKEYPTEKLMETEKKTYIRLLSVFSHDLIPYLSQGFKDIYPPSLVNKFTILDYGELEELVRPLKELLPLSNLDFKVLEKATEFAEKSNTSDSFTSTKT